MNRNLPRALIILAAVGASLVAGRPRPARSEGEQPTPLVTGKLLAPQGEQVEVGSFPVNMASSADGKFVAVTDSGFREYLSILDASTGKVVSRIAVGRARGNAADKQGLYYGLAFGPSRGGNYTLYASRGAEETVAVYDVSAQGGLEDTGRRLESRFVNHQTDMQNVVAGIALNADGSRVYIADNNTSPGTGMKGSLTIVETATGRQVERITLPGFPFGVAAVTAGPDADRKVYVGSERDGVVSVVDPVAMKRLRDIHVGANPTVLLLDRAQKRLFVSNSAGDTISIVDTRSDRVVRTVLLRPDAVRGLAGATPLGTALSPDESRLYVALADMNAVAVIALPGGDVRGYLPAGWYPTACMATADGRRLLVSNAKGVARRNPNGKRGPNGQYIQDLLEGTVASIPLTTDLDLKQMTTLVLENNRVADTRKPDFHNPGIEHIIYIIKENRTYDQVLGDLGRGNGDAALTLFPREVTPNLHALAERFVTLDNFYCCAEVSADGWNWSTSAMAGEYAARNAPYNYSGRGRVYDYEGQNNGVAVDLLGLPDVCRAPGGYIWDNAVRHGISLRNYGFFCSFRDPQTRTKTGPLAPVVDSAPDKRALEGRTDLNFRPFDLDYADSDAWKIFGFDFRGRKKDYGSSHAESRVEEWRRDYDERVRSGDMPRLMTVRLGNDHTKGTSAGQPTPRAYAADNDFAVGQVVEHVSKGPYWKTTAIFIVEDDAQDGHDHVDAHRSIAFVISPFTKRGTLDSRFYNTASTLRTMELLLGLPPMCQYDAIARPFGFFDARPDNDAPYEAILPARRIVTELNRRTAYGASESAKMAFKDADAAPDDALNSILWHAIKGANTPEPAKRYGVVRSAGQWGE